MSSRIAKNFLKTTFYFQFGIFIKTSQNIPKRVVGKRKPECRDVNECKEGLHNCSQNAKCSNKVGSFNCTCLKVVFICLFLIINFAKKYLKNFNWHLRVFQEMVLSVLIQTNVRSSSKFLLVLVF